MKKTSLLAMAALLAVSAGASAGEKVNIAVIVDLALRGAGGSLGAARNSNDTRQTIGCMAWDTMSLSDPDPDQGVLIVCRAVNAAGVSFSCETTNPKFLRVVAGIGTDSWVSFAATPEGWCSRIQVENASRFEPKK